MSTTTFEKPMATPAAILKRRNVRHFKPDAIPADILKQLIELTIAAPSSWNLQDWRIVLVQDEAQKQKLSEASWGQQQVVQAPVTFVFLADADGAWDKDMNEIYDIARQHHAWPEERIDYLKENMPKFQENLKQAGLAREYAVKDAMIAATHLLIAAESFGLSTCIMNGWIEAQVKSVIGISEHPNLAVAVLVSVGYSDNIPSNPGRLPIPKRVFAGNLNQPYQLS